MLILATVAGLTLWYLFAARDLAGEFGLPLDDGWIHARFAQNLARGQGFSFNPGEPTSTTTSTLWTLLLAAGYGITHEHLFTGVVINYALALGLCAVVYSLVVALTTRPWLALASALLCAVTVPLPWWILSGMEPPLYAFLALLGILLHLRCWRTRGARSLLPTVAFALASLARPEMLLLFPLALVDRLFCHLREGEGRPLARWGKDVALHLPVFAVITAPAIFYNVAVTGYPLPTSFYSKLQRVGISGALVDERVTWLSALLLGPLEELWRLVAVWARDNCLLIVPFFFGFGWLVRQAFVGEVAARRSLLVPAVLVTQPLMWAAVGGYRDPSYQSQRYIADLILLFLLVGMVGGWRLTALVPFGARTKQPRPTRRRMKRRQDAAESATRLGGLGVGLRVFLVASVLVASLARQPAGADTYARNVRDTNEMQVRIGRWLRSHVEGKALLCVNDIGAIGYISDMPVVDLQGLVTPEILPLRSLARRLDGTAPRRVLEFIVEHEPDYLIIFPRWYPDLDMRRDLFTPVFGVTLEENITNGASVMVVYRTIWADVPHMNGEAGR
jgi:hypothetical protein